MWAFHENQVLRIARDAGDVIMECLANPEMLEIEQKEDGSNVTLADKMAHKITMELGEEWPEMNSIGKVLTPGTPVLSEEMPLKQHQEIMKQGTYWCVDPLDGTDTAIKYSQGLKDRNGFGVLIALVKDGIPVFGVAHYPAQGRVGENGKPGGLTYYTSADGKAAFRQEGDDRPVRLKKVTRQAGEGLRIAVSYNEKNPRPVFAGQEMEAFPQAGGGRFLRVAEGLADTAYMSVYPGQWDVAAPAAICRAVGVEMRTLPTTDVQNRDALRDSEPLRFDGRHVAPGYEDKPYLNYCAAATPELFRTLGARNVGGHAL